MRLFFPLSGDDVFISYSRRDGALYAAGLADKLTERKLSCFIDKLGTEPNHDLPPSLKKKIKNCTVFVLVGTEKATQSEFVKKEIAEFKQTGRTILPIDFGGNVANAIWYEEIPGLAVETEKDAESLETGNPSQNVIGFIEKSFKYTRRNQYMSRMFWGALSVFLILVGLGVGASYYAFDRIKFANDKIVEAKKAQEKTKLANEKTKIADIATKRADEKNKLAQEKTKIADAETKRANKEKSIADATRLSNESVDLLSQNDPTLLEQSYNRAITANQLVETNGLFLTEPISSLRKVLAFTPQIIRETSLPRLKLETKCDDETLSINKLSFACRKGNKIEVYQILNPEKPPNIFDFKENLAKQEVHENKEDYENSCLYNTSENTVPTPKYLRVSDDGNSVALSVADEYFGEDGRRDGELDGHRILVRTLKKASVCQETNDIQFIKLSPDGESLIYSDRNYGGYNDADINRLKLWRIRKGSTILDCGSSLNLELIGNYSPDGKRFVTATSVGSDNSITIINQFLIDSPKESANCTQTPLVDEKLNTQSEYFLASDYITIELGKVTDIAINNTGNKIALKSNGISIWKLSSYPKLEVLIPPQSSAYSSFLFVEEPSSKQENLMTLTINKMQINSQTWSIKSYEGGEECEICNQNRDPLKLSGFSAEHPEFNFEINESKTRLIIKRKSDSAVVDKIEFGEVIEAFAFSVDGSEFITVSYKESALINTGERFNGRKDYNYRRWKIGYRNLSKIIKQRLPQFSLKE